MTESKFNSYTGRWASKMGFLTVDAPTLEAAVMEMRRVKGKDPMTVVRFKDNVYIADETVDNIHIRIFTNYIRSKNETSTPDFGQVYPKEVSIPCKDQAIITAVPNKGYRFLSYTDENNEVVSMDSEFKFMAIKDTVLYANFQKGGRIDIPYTFNEQQFLVTDDNYVSIKTTETIINDANYIPTSRAVYQGLEGKVDKDDADYKNTIESITLNDKEVEIEDKIAKIDLTQDYLYEDEDIDFNNLM